MLSLKRESIQTLSLLMEARVALGQHLLSFATRLAEGLSFVHSVLVGTNLRDPVDKSKSKIALIASGKHLTGMSLFKSFALGADVANAARSFLFSLGCIQALKCNTNTCPTGITTQ